MIKTFSNIVIFAMGLLHVYILILEMFLWTKPKGLKVFSQTIERAQATAVLAANQGLYNGFLAAGLFWSFFHPTVYVAWQLKVFFSLCVLVAGLYGGYSVHRKIFMIQGVPALISLVLLGVVISHHF